MIAHRREIAIGGQQLCTQFNTVRADDHVDRPRHDSAPSQRLVIRDGRWHEIKVEHGHQKQWLEPSPDCSGLARRAEAAKHFEHDDVADKDRQASRRQQTIQSCDLARSATTEMIDPNRVVDQD